MDLTAQVGKNNESAKGLANIKSEYTSTQSTTQNYAGVDRVEQTSIDQSVSPWVVLLLVIASSLIFVTPSSLIERWRGDESTDAGVKDEDEDKDTDKSNT